MRRLLTVVALVLAAAPVGAQFQQYFAPGSLGETEDPLRKQIESAMESARWHLGPVRLQPWVGIRNFGYVDNVWGTVNNPVSDFTITAGAGLRAYIPLGSKTILFARALPEYIWWKDTESRRKWAGRYSAGAMLFLNRVTLEAVGNRTDDQSYINAEVSTTIPNRYDTGTLSLDLRLLGRLSFVAQGSRSQFRILTSDATPEEESYLKTLERDEQVVSAGLRYAFSESISLTLGGHRSDVDFLDKNYDRSNTGEGYYGLLSFSRRRLTVNVNYSFYTIDPKDASQFAQLDGNTGQANVSYKLTDRVQAQVYGGRTLSYSAGQGAPYYIENRVGAAVRFPLGWRVSTRVFLEKGDLSYPAYEQAPAYTVDRTGGGTSVSLRISKGVTLSVTYNRWRNDYGDTVTEVSQLQTSMGLLQLGWW
jgi:hypothetical protein